MSVDLIVTKLGGWSLETPENTDRSIDIITQDDRRRVVVVSGPKGLTDLYLQAAREHILRKSTLETYRKIMSKWEELCSRLELEGSLGSIRVDFEQMFAYYGPPDLDSIKAKRFLDNIARLGEYNEAKYIFVPRLNKRGIKAIFLDPKDIIYGSDSPAGALILPESTDNLRREIISRGLVEEYVVVIPGFYCFTKNGDVVTLDVQ